LAGYLTPAPKDFRRRRWVAPVVVAVLVLALLATPLGYLTLTLNKINRDDSAKQIDPAIGNDLDRSGFERLFEGADADIRANLSDDILWHHKDVVNILLAGLDYGGNEGFKSQYWPRADAILLLSVNKQTRRVTVVSISRATYVAIPGFPNGRVNLGHAFGGAALLKKTVEQNYKVRLDHVMTVDFDGFAALVDIMGGVTVSLDEKEAEALQETLRNPHGAGSYELTGSAALAYTRLRYIDSDRARTQRQRNVLEQLAQKATQMDLNQINQCISSILPLVTTDMTNLQLLSLLPYLRYDRSEAIIPRTAVPLTVVNGQEVLILSWSTVRRDIHELLYPGIQTMED
jgi:LCP family protein required for cell wall assembly